MCRIKYNNCVFFSALSPETKNHVVTLGRRFSGFYQPPSEGEVRCIQLVAICNL